MDHEEIVLHGHRVSYRQAGWGPVVVLIHGITGSSVTWEEVIEPLAERYTVIAPDLIGHGESAKPKGDYSLGAHASGVRGRRRCPARSSSCRSWRPRGCSTLGRTPGACSTGWACARGPTSTR